ncbi:MAG: hypothetical protein ABIJ37_07775 [Pseudomonadota bacterium]
MKRLMMTRKRIKGQEFQAVDLTAVKRPESKAMSVRETTRIHAMTGVPWEQINRKMEEAKV